MPRYTRVYSVIRVVGHLWQPGVVAATRYTLSASDLENLLGDSPLAEVTREAVLEWLAEHSGDYQEIMDVKAELSHGEMDVTVPWASEESELIYNDAMYPTEED